MCKGVRVSNTFVSEAAPYPLLTTYTTYGGKVVWVSGVREGVKRGKKQPLTNTRLTPILLWGIGVRGTC